METLEVVTVEDLEVPVETWEVEDLWVIAAAVVSVDPLELRKAPRSKGSKPR